MPVVECEMIKKKKRKLLDNLEDLMFWSNEGHGAQLSEVWLAMSSRRIINMTVRTTAFCDGYSSRPSFFAPQWPHHLPLTSSPPNKLLKSWPMISWSRYLNSWPPLLWTKNAHKISQLIANFATSTVGPSIRTWDWQSKG